MPRNVSDNKALEVSMAVIKIGQKVLPNYQSRYDAPRWTQDMEEVLIKLPVTAIKKLEFLICEGSFERSDSGEVSDMICKPVMEAVRNAVIDDMISKPIMDVMISKPIMDVMIGKPGPTLLGGA